MSSTDLTDSRLDRGAIRREFPALARDTVFLENAGGSQVPRLVADAMRDYMLSCYAQLGAGYPESRQADAVVEAAHAFVNRLVNGTGRGEVILGPSSTQLVSMLAQCYADVLAPGDEVIITETGHETNIGPWVKLAERGIEVRTWRVDPDRQECPLEALDALLGERTRVVALVHVSNLLGQVVDVKQVTERVHASSRARVVVDGVAYAPHRAIDVVDGGVDWYVYSTYKVYGPHMAALWGARDALAELTGPNHFFIPRDEVPYKFELGGACHEGCAGVLALGDYLRFLAAVSDTPAGARASLPFGALPLPDGPIAHGDGEQLLQLWNSPERAEIERAFEVMARCERPLQRRILEFLERRADVRVIGPPDGPDRVGTISFVCDGVASVDVVAAVQARGVGVRNGHMYAHRLCSALGIDLVDGVVRVSLVHYNDDGDVNRLLEALETVL